MGCHFSVPKKKIHKKKIKNSDFSKNITQSTKSKNNTHPDQFLNILKFHHQHQSDILLKFQKNINNTNKIKPTSSTDSISSNTSSRDTMPPDKIPQSDSN
jgi:hypothetical protein